MLKSVRRIVFFSGVFIVSVVKVVMIINRLMLSMWFLKSVLSVCSFVGSLVVR